MDAELKTKWVEALRSGEYGQVRYTLCDGRGSYCCIGVLAEVSGMTFNSEGLLPHEQSTLGYHVLLPIPREHVQPLVMMNDTENKSFTEIADYIEVNL